MFAAFVVLDTRRQEAGRLDTCCGVCRKTKKPENIPSRATINEIGTDREWVRRDTKQV